MPRKKGRIEIIPLIDIMFFLLASFMLASLSMIRLQSVKMDLPTATTASKKLQPGILNISIDKAGVISIDKVSMSPIEITSVLSNKFRANTNVPVYISADTEALHGTGPSSGHGLRHRRDRKNSHRRTYTDLSVLDNMNCFDFNNFIMNMSSRVDYRSQSKKSKQKHSRKCAAPKVVSPKFGGGKYLSTSPEQQMSAFQRSEAKVCAVKVKVRHIHK
jgi:biopolymer transport protein ExbD